MGVILSEAKIFLREIIKTNNLFENGINEKIYIQIPIFEKLFRLRFIIKFFKLSLIIYDEILHLAMLECFSEYIFHNNSLEYQIENSFPSKYKKTEILLDLAIRLKQHVMQKRKTLKENQMSRLLEIIKTIRYGDLNYIRKEFFNFLDNHPYIAKLGLSPSTQQITLSDDSQIWPLYESFEKIIKQIGNVEQEFIDAIIYSFFCKRADAIINTLDDNQDHPNELEFDIIIEMKKKFPKYTHMQQKNFIEYLKELKKGSLHISTINFIENNLIDQILDLSEEYLDVKEYELKKGMFSKQINRVLIKRKINILSFQKLLALYKSIPLVIFLYFFIEKQGTRDIRREFQEDIISLGFKKTPPLENKTKNFYWKKVQPEEFDEHIIHFIDCQIRSLISLKKLQEYKYEITLIPFNFASIHQITSINEELQAEIELIQKDFAYCKMVTPQIDLIQIIDDFSLFEEYLSPDQYNYARKTAKIHLQQSNGRPVSISEIHNLSDTQKHDIFRDLTTDKIQEIFLIINTVSSITSKSHTLTSWEITQVSEFMGKNFEINQFLDTIPTIISKMEQDELIKNAYRKDDYNEKIFRNYFFERWKEIFKYIISEDIYEIEKESDSRSDRPQDISILKIGKWSLSIEFKIYPPSSGGKDALEEILDYSSTVSNTGIIIVFNKRNIKIDSDDYFKKMHVNRSGYLENSYKELPSHGNLFNAISFNYDSNNNLYKLHHIGYDLSNLRRSLNLDPKSISRRKIASFLPVNTNLSKKNKELIAEQIKIVLKRTNQFLDKKNMEYLSDFIQKNAPGIGNEEALQIITKICKYYTIRID